MELYETISIDGKIGYIASVDELLNLILVVFGRGDEAWYPAHLVNSTSKSN